MAWLAGNHCDGRLDHSKDQMAHTMLASTRWGLTNMSRVALFHFFLESSKQGTLVITAMFPLNQRNLRDPTGNKKWDTL